MANAKTSSTSAELRRSKHAWIALPSALLQTRYQLNAIALSFSDAETATTIQATFRDSQLSGGTEFNQYYLIAEPHADEPCYNISDYIHQCVAGDFTIAERLRGRTVINLYQTEGAADDLLSEQGVFSYIARMLRGYLKTYGKQSPSSVLPVNPQVFVFSERLRSWYIISTVESCPTRGGGNDTRNILAVSVL